MLPYYRAVWKANCYGRISEIRDLGKVWILSGNSTVERIIGKASVEYVKDNGIIMEKVEE